MNFGTKLRTVLVIATCFNTALMSTDITGFANVYVDFVYKILSIACNFVIVFCATYFNNDYTEIACEHTGQMRAEKAVIDEDYIGETYDDPEDEEDEVDDHE